MLVLLAQQLLARGWSWETLRPLFRDAYYGITASKTKSNINKPNNNMQPLYIHIVYHPRGIMRTQLRQIYLETLGQIIDNPVTIAVARPKNLKQRLCNSKLQHVEGNNPSDIIDKIAGTTHQR